jgi:Family of unknown function (DUF5681)
MRRREEQLNRGILILNRASAGRGDKGYFLRNNEIGKKTRFKPGQSGNPSGRPKKSELDYALEDFLDSEITIAKGNRRDRKRKLAAKALVEALFKQALAGKVRIAKLIFERIGGKPTQRINADLEEPTFSDPVARKARIKELQKVLSSSW